MVRPPRDCISPSLLHNWCWAFPGHGCGGGLPAAEEAGGGAGGLGRCGRASDPQPGSPPPITAPQAPPLQDNSGGPWARFQLTPQIPAPPMSGFRGTGQGHLCSLSLALLR